MRADPPHRRAASAALGAALLLAAALPASSARADDAPRLFSTRDGSSGGLDVVDAGSAAPGSVRLSLVLDAIPGSDFLHDSEDVSQSRQALSFSWTALPSLELHAALQNRDTSSEAREPASIHAQRVTLGLKLAADPIDVWRLGGGLRLSLPNEIGGQGPTLEAASLGLAGAVTLDLRRASHPTPLLARLNVGYLLDNSGEGAEETEAARYESLSDPLGRSDDDRHLLTRLERYAFELARNDALQLGLGVEIPLEIAERTFVHPLLEGRLDIPVNRQDYDCPTFVGIDGVGESYGETDACLHSAGAKAWASHLALGLRVAPPIRGVSFTLALQVGLSGTDHFVHELPPNPPLALTLALGYDYEPLDEPDVALRESAPMVAAEPVAPLPPPLGRIRGTLTDAATGSPIGGATVELPGGDLGALSTGADGRFVSYALEPGEVSLRLTHPDYEPGRCKASLGADGADARVSCSLAPRPAHAKLGGRITDSFGAPLGGVRIRLSGPTTAQLASDAQGRYAREQLAAGSYRVQIESEGHLWRVLDLELSPRQEASLDAALVPRPTTPGVRIESGQIVAPELRFEGDAMTLAPKAAAAAAEVADLLLREPSIRRIRIAGGGGETRSLARAETVRARLVAAGVEAVRVEAAAGEGASVVISVLP